MRSAHKEPNASAGLMRSTSMRGAGGERASDAAGPLAEAARRIQHGPGARHPTATFRVKTRDAYSAPRWRG